MATFMPDHFPMGEKFSIPNRKVVQWNPEPAGHFEEVSTMGVKPSFLGCLICSPVTAATTLSKCICIKQCIYCPCVTYSWNKIKNSEVNFKTMQHTVIYFSLYTNIFYSKKTVVHISIVFTYPWLLLVWFESSVVQSWCHAMKYHLKN